MSIKLGIFTVLTHILKSNTEQWIKPFAVHQVNILDTKQNREAKWINLKTCDKDIVPWWQKAMKKMNLKQ